MVNSKPKASVYEIRTSEGFTSLIASKQKNLVLFLLKKNDGQSEQLKSMIKECDEGLKPLDQPFKIFYYFCEDEVC